MTETKEKNWQDVRLPKRDQNGIRMWPSLDSLEWKQLIYTHKKIYETRNSMPRANIQEALLGIPPQYPSDASVNLLKMKMEADFEYWLRPIY